MVSDHSSGDYSAETELGAAPWLAGGTTAIILKDKNDVGVGAALARLLSLLGIPLRTAKGKVLLQ